MPMQQRAEVQAVLRTMTADRQTMLTPQENFFIETERGALADQ
jgi:hypothetical protein